jgi:copper resistance protein C
MVGQKMRRLLLSFLFAVEMMASSPVYAHAHLQNADPPIGSDVSSGPSTLRLHFSESIELGFSSVSITMDNGMAVAPSDVALAPGDASTIVVTLKGSLGPGRYNVAWHVVSVDTHRTQGHYEFTVKP